MKLIFLYGPPAAGKHTVGQELSDRTGYRFFYNHLTIPVARSVFPRHQEPNVDELCNKLVKDLRLLVIDAAAAANTDLIFTLAYSGTVDNDSVAAIVATVQKHGGTVCFVELHAPIAALKDRLDTPSRHELRKLVDPERLDYLFETKDLTASVPYDAILKLDTSTLTPTQAAEAIMQNFDISTNK